MHQSPMESFLHGLISSVFCHYSWILVSSGYMTGFMSRVLCDGGQHSVTATKSPFLPDPPLIPAHILSNTSANMPIVLSNWFCSVSICM